MEKPDKCRNYDAFFKTEVPRVISESRSTQAASRTFKSKSYNCFISGSRKRC